MATTSPRKSRNIDDTPRSPFRTITGMSRTTASAPALIAMIELGAADTPAAARAPRPRSRVSTYTATTAATST